MATDTIDRMGKTRGRKPKHDRPEGEDRSGSALNVRIDPAVRQALDDFIESQRLPSTLTDAVELALTEFLKTEGFWPRRAKK